MKWGIREAVDVYFKAKGTFKLGARTIRKDEPVLIFDTVKTSTMEVASEVSYVQGGKGNPRLLSYEGDKSLTFKFEDALLSNEGLAILSGADLIPARNKHLNGSSSDAQSVIAHNTEKYSVATNNQRDTVYDETKNFCIPNPSNVLPYDATLGKYNDYSFSPKGGKWNLWLSNKPYVGANSSIYVMLLDEAGEMSGAPMQINLANNIRSKRTTGIIKDVIEVEIEESTVKRDGYYTEEYVDANHKSIVLHYYDKESASSNIPRANMTATKIVQQLVYEVRFHFQHDNDESQKQWYYASNIVEKYNSSNAYNKYDVCYHEDDSTYYYAKQDIATGTAFSLSNWQPLTPYSTLISASDYGYIRESGWQVYEDGDGGSSATSKPKKWLGEEWDSTKSYAKDKEVIHNYYNYKANKKIDANSEFNLTDWDFIDGYLSTKNNIIDGISVQFEEASTNDYKDFIYTGLSKWEPGDKFVAFDVSGVPICINDEGLEPNVNPRKISDENWNSNSYSCGEYDDQVGWYVDWDSLKDIWDSQYSNYCSAVVAEFGTEVGTIKPEKAKGLFVRTIGENYGNTWGDVDPTDKTTYYSYLLQPSGGYAQPRAYREGSSFVYKVNAPSILYQDIVLVDYYKEYQHDATQVSILPDKFGPYMYVEGSSLVRRASDGTDLPIEFVIPKLKIKTALTFTLQSTGDPSTFTFEGDAFPDFSKFDQTRKVLADIQILDADDNYDEASEEMADPTSYRRYKYNNNDGEYLWKDRSIHPHQNIDYSDTASGHDEDDGAYDPQKGGPASLTPGNGSIG